MNPNLNGGFLRGGLSFLKNFDYAGLLDGTSKTLSVINQAIPVYNQIKPIVSNIKTISKISSVLSEDEEETPKEKGSPIFYI